MRQPTAPGGATDSWAGMQAGLGNQAMARMVGQPGGATVARAAGDPPPPPPGPTTTPPPTTGTGTSTPASSSGSGTGTPPAAAAGPPGLLEVRQRQRELEAATKEDAKETNRVNRVADDLVQTARRQPRSPEQEAADGARRRHGRRPAPIGPHDPAQRRPLNGLDPRLPDPDETITELREIAAAGGPHAAKAQELADELQGIRWRGISRSNEKAELDRRLTNLDPRPAVQAGRLGPGGVPRGTAAGGAQGDGAQSAGAPASGSAAAPPGTSSGGPTTMRTVPATGATAKPTAEMREAIVNAKAGVARSEAFTERIKAYLKVYDALKRGLTMLGALNTATGVLAAGTVLPKEEQHANEILAEANRVGDAIQDLVADLDVVKIGAAIQGAKQRRDAAGLAQYAAALEERRDALVAAQRTARAQADLIDAQLPQILDERVAQIGQFVAGLTSAETATSGTALLTESALQRVQGTTTHAGVALRAAAESLEPWVAMLRALVDLANSEALALNTENAFPEAQDTHAAFKQFAAEHKQQPGAAPAGGTQAPPGAGPKTR